MARTDTLHLKVTTDTSEATELVPRIGAAVRGALAAAGLAVADSVVAAAAADVMAEIIRVRQATPEESAQARVVERVRSLHRQEYGSCAECTHESSVLYPCPTIRALDTPEPTP